MRGEHMKQTLKKFMSIALMIICIVTLTACGSTATTTTDTAESYDDSSMESSLASMGESLTNTIVELTDEEIENYLASDDEFTCNAMEAWESNKDDLGEYKTVGEATVEETSDGYTVTVPVEFEKRNADLVYVFSEDGSATDLSVNIEYSLGEKMQQAGMNTVMGIGIVFLMLLFLSALISLFKYIPMIVDKRANKKETPEIAKAAPVAPAVPEQKNLTDDSELVAVIAAAIAASEGTSTDSFVVRSIRKVNRRKW
jgi:sodium pump decarboxylase gamma subunit